MSRKLGLLGGIGSAAIYVVATTVVGALAWDGYSTAHQTVSELSAIDSPSRPAVVSLVFLSSLLVIAFGWAVRESARGGRALRVVGGLLIAYGAFCLTGPFTPMHQRGIAPSTTDVLHIAGAIVDVALIVSILGFGAFALGTRFRVYSIVTLLVVVGFGAWGGAYGAAIAANLPTPWVGVIERVCIYAFDVWLVVLAIARWPQPGSASARPKRGKSVSVSRNAFQAEIPPPASSRTINAQA